MEKLEMPKEGKELMEKLIADNLMKVFVDTQVATILAQVRAKEGLQRKYIG